MLIIPYVWAQLTVPDVWGAIASVHTKTLALAMFFGACWGVGAIMFGLAVNYLGVSLTYGITMGLAAAMGSIVPLLQVPRIGENPALPFILIGLLVVLVGIAILTLAGIRRDQLTTAGGSGSSRN
jgi:L-rhamnose-H+ transport protein